MTSVPQVGHPVYLFSVLNALLEAGFRHTLAQRFEPGQQFGVVYALDERFRVHVRGFGDGRIDAHVEPEWWFQEHHDREAADAGVLAAEVLRQLRIPFNWIDGGRDRPAFDRSMPLTDWRGPILKLLGLSLAAIGLVVIVKNARSGVALSS